MAEGGGLLNRYRLVKAYRGFESLRLRQFVRKPFKSHVWQSLPTHEPTIFRGLGQAMALSVYAVALPLDYLSAALGRLIGRLDRR